MRRQRAAPPTTLDELTDAAITVIGEHVPKKSSPLSF
jgi:hypothetical protein